MICRTRALRVIKFLPGEKNTKDCRGENFWNLNDDIFQYLSLLNGMAYMMVSGDD